MAVKGDPIIYGAAGTLAVVGFFNPVPLLDHVFLLATWAGMLGTLAHSYDVEFDGEAFKTLMLQIIISIGAYIVGVLAFLTIVKWTGVGTFPAAIANAALNFSFTWVIGNSYREAWAEGRTPEPDEIERKLRAAVDTVKTSMERDNRKRLKRRYDELRTSGVEQKDAIIKVLMEEFGMET